MAVAVPSVTAANSPDLFGKQAVIRVGCSECPGDAAAPENPMSGFSNAITIEAARRRNIRLEWIRTKADPETQLAEHKVDLYPRLVPLHPSNEVAFSRPWLKMTYTLLAKRGAPISMSQMTGIRVGYANNPFNASVVARRLPGAVATPVVGVGRLIQAVCQGEVDAGMLETRMVQTLLLRERPECEGTRFQLIPMRGESLPASFASHQGSVWAAEALRAEVDELVRDGTLGRIHGEWFFTVASEVEGLYQEVVAQQRISMLTAISCLLALVLAGALWQNSRVRRAQRSAVEANQAKSRFLANVSHELRTPLNGILGLSRMILDRDDVPDEVRELTALSQQSSQTLVRLINDLLDLARVEAGKLDMTTAPLVLREMVAEAAAMVRPAAAAKALAFELAVDPLLPTVVAGDAGRIRQVLLNLLSNAVKFTAQGSVRIEVGPAEPGVYGDGRITFRVIDTGRGIPPEALSKLFVAFEQVDSKQDPKLGGSGLGLSISRKLVEAMGGTMSVFSRGPGSCFEFTLPLIESVAVAQAKPLSLGKASPVKVLLCEDNPVNQRVAMHMLRRLGHEVELAENGVRAVEKAGQSDYDVILMDCHMPEMDGFEASRQIRGLARACSTPIIALTASAYADDIERCRKAGMTAHLAKPVSMEELQRAISQASEHRL